MNGEREPAPTSLTIGYGGDVLLHLEGPTAIAASLVLSVGILTFGGVCVYAFFRD